MNSENEDIRRDETFDKVRDTFFLTRWLSLHTFILLWRSMRNPLQRSDMFNLSRDMFPQTNLKRFEQAKNKHKDRSLQTLLFTAILLPLILTGAALTALSTIMTVSGPLAVKYILSFLKNPHSTIQDQQRITRYVTIWIMLYFVRIFVNQLAERQFILAAVKTQQILSLLVHEKIIQLPLNYRLNMKRGSLYAIVNNEVKAIASFVLSASSVFSTPVCLISIQLLIFYEFKLYGLVMTFCIIVGSIIQLTLAYLMHDMHWRKIIIHSGRIGCNVEFLNSMKDLKLLGWEDLMVNKNVQSRRRECELSKDFFLYLNVWQLVISLAPMVVVLFVQALKSISVHRSLDTPSVYLLLSYVSLAYSPSKAFLITFVKGLEASRALQKIEEFLKIEQNQPKSTKNLLLRPGEIIIKNLVAASQDTQQNYYCESAMSQIDERQHLFKKTIDFTSPKKYIQSLKHAYINVPFELRFKKGDRVILLSDSNGGKSSLMRAIQSQLKVERGIAWYNGKIAIVTQKLWFRKKSIRDNVTFGEPVVTDKLEKVYKLCGLDSHIRNLPKGDQTIIQQHCGWSSAKKLKIAIARVLYSEPDIVFLDEPFASIDPQTAHLIYNNICRILKNTTLIISSQVTAFIHPDDKVLLLNDRVAVEFGIYSAILKEFQRSYAHKMLYLDKFERDHLTLKQKELEKEELLRKQAERENRKRKIKIFLKCLLALTRSKSEEQISSLIEIDSAIYEEKAAEATELKRIPPVPWQFYKKYYQSAPLFLFGLLYVTMVFAQAAKVFSDWWLGMIKSNPYYLTSRQAMAIYIASTLVCGVLLAVTGFISPSISKRAAKALTTQLSKSMAYSSFTFFETQNPLRVALKINRDVEEFFNVNNLLQSILRNLLFFLATVILLSLKSPWLFLTIGIAIIVINLGILKVYINADRELFSFRMQYLATLSKTFEEVINGIDLFRAYQKLHLLQKDIIRDVYRYNVQLTNYRFIAQGMTILCEISGLCILAAAAFFAIKLKFSTKPENLAIVGTSISFCLRMTTIVANIVRDSTRLDNQLKICVKGAFEIIGKNQENLFEEPKPPENWPLDNSVELENVSLKYPSMKKPIVSEISFRIDSGSKFAICGKGGSGKGTVLAGIARTLLPVPNADGKTGTIKVGQVDTKTIGRKYYSQQVMMLTSYPMIFTGSVRQNLDPFDAHTDSSLREALELVELWEEIESNEDYASRIVGRLSYVLTDGGAQLTQNQQQRLNIARALVRQPAVLICDNFTSSLDMVMKERILKAVEGFLKKTTIILIPESAKIAVECEQVVYMSRGLVQETGTPRELVARRQSFAKLVQSGSRFYNILLGMPQVMRKLQKEYSTQEEISS